MAKKTVTQTSKTPTGLSIKRNGNRFVFSWTNAETYTDLDLNIQVGYGTNSKITFPYKAGAKDQAANACQLDFPYTYVNAKKQRFVINPTRFISFRVRGIGVPSKDTSSVHYVKKESNWSGWYTYNIIQVSTPSISASVFQDVDNRTNFSWSVPNTDAANNRWYLYHQYRLCHQWEGDKSISYGGWNRINPSSWSWSLPETDISQRGFRRRVEVRAIGKRANSPVVGAEHIYNTPYAPSNVITQASQTYSDSDAGNIQLRASWDVNSSYWHPVDICEFAYCISTPSKNMEAPFNLDGTVVSTIEPRYKTGGNNNTAGVSIKIDKHVDANECLFYRIRNKYDNRTSTTKWFRVDKISAVLSDPENLSVTPNVADTQYYHIEADNTAASDVPDSFLAIYFRATYSDGSESDPKIIGIIPNDESSVDVAMPDDPQHPKDPTKIPSSLGFAAMALAYKERYYPISISGGGTEEPTKNEVFNFIKADLYTKSGETYTPVPGSAGYEPSTQYYAKFKIDVNWWKVNNNFNLYKYYDTGTTDDDFVMSSQQIWKNGEVPQPPTNFQIMSTNNGIAVASWDWNWSLASYIELSWSTYREAWQSTDEPDSYRVARVNGSKWNIVGLNPGEVYFFKARFIKVLNDAETAGPYSPIATLNLTAAPLTPVLILSRTSITENQDVVASWSYTSADTTPQDKAEIFLVTTDSYGTRRGHYRPAIDKLDKDDQGHYIFDPSKTYYTYSEETDTYTIVANPVDDPEILKTYFIFDDTSPLASTEDGSTVQSLTLNASALGLKTGEGYNLSLRLTSKSGIQSDWSPPVNLTIVPPLEPPVIPSIPQFIPEVVTETGTSETGGEEVEKTRAYLALKALPFTLNVTGAGSLGTTMVTIERTTAFFTNKPDERTDVGYKDEVVALIRKEGEGEITIDRNDLMGYLDDGAQYKLVVTIIDENGQSATNEYATAEVNSSTFEQYKTILFTRTTEKPYEYIAVNDEGTFDPNETYYFKNEFIVEWTHQPVIPEATCEVDTRYKAVKITTGVPNELVDGDVVDIYRLSVDRPQLIVENGIFGETYVDPYPALGEFGGHRIVYKTVNGDFITHDRHFAWADLGEEDGDHVDTEYSLVNFPEGSVEILYNIDLSNNWKKDFQETRYLGGHIQGDWNPGVSRTGSINTVSVTTQDQDTIQLIRRLADYPGIVHIRTRDGSSYAANVDVSETLNHQPYELVTYSLSFTRVDTQELDGMTLEQWNRYIKEGE